MDLKEHKWYGPRYFKEEEYNQLSDKGKNTHDRKSPLTLDLVQCRSRKDHYLSIFNFYLDLLQACTCRHIIGPASVQQKRNDKLKQLCIFAIKTVFPWFDIQNTAMLEDFFHSKENKMRAFNKHNECLEHAYASICCSKTNLKDFMLGTALLPIDAGDHTCQSSYSLRKDERKCQFCNQYGDHEEDRSGRLLYYRQNEWVHINCALWSSEVYEEIDGSLQNVWQALNRGSKLSCTYCGERGATIGCNHNYCDSNYHFECGLNDGAIYKDDKKVFCARHINSKANSQAIPKMEDLSCLRTVHIEADRDQKKYGSRKLRLFDLRKITIRIGALTINSLGYLHGDVSDASKSLIPVNFECTRIFWSTLKPSKRIKYHCRVSLVLPEKSIEVADRNLVIDHENISKTHFNASLQEFKSYVNNENEKEKLLMKKKARKKLIEQGNPIFDVLPPNREVLHNLGKHLSYKTIHEDDMNAEQYHYDREKNTKIGAHIHYDDDEWKRILKEKNLDQRHIEESEQDESFHPDMPRNPTFTPKKPLNKAVSNVINRTSPNKNDLEKLAWYPPQESLDVVQNHALSAEEMPETLSRDERQESLVEYIDSFDESTSYNLLSRPVKTTIPVSNEKYLSNSIINSQDIDQYHTEICENIVEGADVITYAGSESSCGSLANEPSNTVESVSEISGDIVMDAIDLAEYNEISNVSDVAQQAEENVQNILDFENENSNGVDLDIEIIKNILAFNGKIPGQLDGIDDSEDSISSGRKRAYLVDENLEEQPHKRQKLKTHTNDTNICSGIERGCNDTHRNNEIIAKPHTSEVVCSVPVENSSSPLLDESPRKDFSIAGLLSPNQENTLSSQTEIKSETVRTVENRRDSDDDIIYLPMNENLSTVKYTSQAKGKKTIPPRSLLEKKCNVLVHESKVTPACNDVKPVNQHADQTSPSNSTLNIPYAPFSSANFIQQPLAHNSTHSQDISLEVFNPSLHKAPQQNLQYLTSVGNLHQLPTLPSTIQYPQNPLQNQILGAPTQFRIASPMVQAPQLAGYIAQQSMISASTSTNPSSLFHIGITPQVTTANIIHHHIHHTPANPIQAAVLQTQGGLFYNQSAHIPPVPYVIGTNSQGYMNQVIQNSSSPGSVSLTTPLQQTQILNNEQLYSSIRHEVSFSSGNQKGLFIQPKTTNASYSSSEDPTLSLGKKVARVQPQPSISKDVGSCSANVKKSEPISRTQDPIRALSSIADQPIPNQGHQLMIAKTETNQSSQYNPLNIFPSHVKHQQRSVGTQAKICDPVKVISPRPWKQVNGDSHRLKPNFSKCESISSSSRGSSVDISRSSSPKSPPGNTLSSLPNSSDRLLKSHSNILDEAINQQRYTTSCSSSPLSNKHLLTSSTLSEMKHKHPGSLGQPSYCTIGQPHVTPGSNNCSDDVKITTKSSKSDSIKFVLQQGGEGNCYKIKNISIKDGSGSPFRVEPKTAVNAIAKAKTVSRINSKKKQMAFLGRLDGQGNVVHSDEDFINEQIIESNGKSTATRLVTEAADAYWRADISKDKSNKSTMLSEECETPYLLYELSSEDGFKAESPDPSHLWKIVFEAVQKARDKHSMTPLSRNPFGDNGLEMLGLTHTALAFLIEQLPGAKQMKNYAFKHHRQLERRRQEDMLFERPSGCSRTEPFMKRRAFDMFNWLANPHRKFPDSLHRSTLEHGQDLILGDLGDENGVGQLLPASKRATSLDLPMAMRFRHLAKNAKEAVGVFSSSIHGRGLYCKRTISAGEMVIEYAGEEIRAILTDKRERR